MAETKILLQRTACVAGFRRRKMAGDKSDDQSLLPGLPDDLAQLCLSRVKPSLLFSVSLSWRRLLYSPFFPPFLSLYALLSCESDPGRSLFVDDSDCARFFTFDPISGDWKSLPSPPDDPPVHILLRHPSFLSRTLPIQSISVNGKLVVLAATTHNLFPALPRPLIFDPITQSWKFGPPLSAPRRWCAAGSLGMAVFVASGMGSNFSPEIARSAEKWELGRGKPTNSEWKWEKMSSLRDANFSRDAIDAVGWRGKLCMVNVKGAALKEGAIYDVKEDLWEEMPKGMVAGWRGPAASMDEEEMYVVDERNGILKKYDPIKDVWDEIMQSERLIGASQMAAGGGRVCVACADGRGVITVVDVGVTPPKTWTVESPLGVEVMALHILPRMSNSNL